MMKLPSSTPLSFITLLSLLALVFIQVSDAIQVSHDDRAITINGQRQIILAGAIHYPRSTPEMWPDLIKKAKEGGLNTIETYVFWNAHEPARRQYDFSGNNDLIRYLKTIQSEGLYSILRIGPYVCAEWNYGGFPVWLHNMPGIELRTANDVFMNEMQNFTTLIVDMVKTEKLFASQGGNIILSQIENEYGNVWDSYGDAGKAYIDWCANMAVSQNIGVPWIMCQQPGPPAPMLEACNGYYCDQYKPKKAGTPKMWTENWTGWFQNWGAPNPKRTAEDLAFAVARFFQTGGTLNNYYMYHGGTNFGRTAGGPYIITTYDYDAPLDEYGNPKQPKWGHLKQLHNVLFSIENTLTYGNSTDTDLGNGVVTTVFATNETSSCFISNTNETSDATVAYQGNQYHVPAWSVSILPDCQTEEYNSAKINTQTSVMVNKPNDAEEQPTSLKWQWRPERAADAIRLGKGDYTASEILDQKAAADDASDYLWYITNLDLAESDLVWGPNMSLRVNETGHILHVFVNGKYQASEWATYGKENYVYEKAVKLRPGKNLISLLSVTVGFKNYGPMYDLIKAGIAGPVEIVSKIGSDETVIKDLSAHNWTYKIGLHGMKSELYSTTSRYVDKWYADNLPTNRKLTWYKTTFKAPLGQDVVTLDLQGMGKGEAWVNGHSLGRYWPSFIADESLCSADPCDYRGSYSGSKCVYNCGKPSQRYYHVPRSFLRDDENTLVLLEEFGGNPGQVNFQTIVVGTACGSAYENRTLELSCNDKPISGIKYAGYGDPQGTCGAFEDGACKGEKDALSIIENACLGKSACAVNVTDDVFGPANCSGVGKKLIVEAHC
uniref:beta-galactosidase n=1 Tax=Kalanchoe fedtschenkoi TaxID=63787 RepID=A0A7N0VCA4_KALFE